MTPFHTDHVGRILDTIPDKCNLCNLHLPRIFVSGDFVSDVEMFSKDIRKKV